MVFLGVGEVRKKKIEFRLWEFKKTFKKEEFK